MPSDGLIREVGRTKPSLERGFEYLTAADRTLLNSMRLLAGHRDSG